MQQAGYMHRNQGAGELFGGDTGVQGRAERIFYDLLVKNRKVTLEEVRDELCPNETGQKVSYAKNYKKIITAGSNVIAAIRAKGGTVHEQRNGQNKIWIYDGTDILKEERTLFDVKTIKKLVELFEASSGMIPFPVSSHFLGHSTLFWSLKNITRNRVVYAEGNPSLKGLELIPELYEHIVRQHVLQFKYHPFGRNPYSPIIHPHVIKLYNNRWFLLGYAKRRNSEKYDISCVALDRIESALHVKADMEYQACEEGLYDRFFDKRIGVSGKQTDIPCEIIIHVHSLYAMGLITTKPFPHQRVIHEYDGNVGYGEVSVQAIWNNELCGDIMRYGELFEVVGPPEIREDIKHKLLNALNRYK